MADGNGTHGSAKTSRLSMLELARGLRNKTKRQNSAATDPSAQRKGPSEKTDFTTLPAYRELRRHRAVADVMGIANPFFRTHESKSGALCEIDGVEYINFVSYDYLGLNGTPELNSAAAAAIEAYGTSVSASRPTAGDRPIHRQLETALAELYETEAALTFVSGHATNVSVIGELLGKGDLILSDQFSHNSIVLGTKLSEAARQSFPHNDMDALERTLAEARVRFDRVLIVVEGLYSMDGDIADLPRLIELKTRYDCWLMVDEAHSLGVLGDTGRGVFEHFGVSPDGVDIWMGTLSKTLSGCGGYIAGPNALIDNLRFNASAFMFSVGMSPPVAAATLAALKKMQNEPERVRRLQANGQRFLEACRAAGLNVGLSAGHAICVVVVGDSLRTAKLAERLFARGVNTIPVTYPAVPMRSARLRFFLTSEHTSQQIGDTVAILSEELGALANDQFGLSTAKAAFTYATRS